MTNRPEHDETLAALRHWQAQARPRHWRLVQYCGVECVGACDLATHDLEARARALLDEGFHIAWRSHGEDAVLRAHEGEPAPAWAAVFDERDLIDGLAAAPPGDDGPLNARRLVACWKREKAAQLLSLLHADSGRAATAKLHELALSPQQTGQVLELLDHVLTDTLYTLLLGLDGEAAVGGEQQRIVLCNEDGTDISPCGELESEAYAQLIERRP